ncbi:predicted protein [Histoplasma capsulatum G186AR]|uniref:Uncharacterized protein n=1 Tax=Ajellomyces capsulatus (strain G186AR / H82 / ATCC MYA-2454 / RMSCC 2432) TaxID=447093 RepID=C0NMJ9_AJECG|nr:uncharacterized protein HCBG_03976 [Histoplasma capsulatum G186AR]EEH07097.1 predicted protein [Histoplasma capsulatum G186AR]
MGQQAPHLTGKGEESVGDLNRSHPPIHTSIRQLRQDARPNYMKKCFGGKCSSHLAQCARASDLEAHKRKNVGSRQNSGRSKAASQRSTEAPIGSLQRLFAAGRADAVCGLASPVPE